ncbi:MAG: rhomboid family intramembrane serine protease [Armatimonadetes bacterium]|nr:rhomboid family intramembrane serine protease [Armatimonadota bacterium]
MNRQFDLSFGKTTPAVKWLVIINSALFLLDSLSRFQLQPIFHLYPPDVWEHRMIWQPISYMFFHANPWHLLLNMLLLWMVGGSVEGTWGSKRFLGFYLTCGLGGAALCMLFSWNAGVVGASGAVLGVMTAFALLFPDAVILAFFLVPMKAKYFISILAGLILLLAWQNPQDGTSHLAHLGGLATAFLYIKGGQLLEGLRKKMPSSRYALPPRRRKKRRPLNPVVVESPRKEQGVLQRQIDEILQKIHDKGLDSLTEEEKRILDKASWMLRQRDGGIINLEDYRR